MRRFVNKKEAGEILTNFTGIDVAVEDCPDTSAVRYQCTLDDARFPRMKLAMRSQWMLDETHQPLSPLNTLRAPSLIEKILGRTDIAPEQAFILAGHLLFTANHDHAGKLPSFSEVDSCEATHFLILQNCPFMGGKKVGPTGWQPVPIYTVEGTCEADKLRAVAWYAAAAVDRRHYWEAYLVPIGFHQPKVKDGLYHINWYGDTEFSSASMLDIIRESETAFLNLYHQELENRERQFDSDYLALMTRSNHIYAELAALCDGLNCQLEQMRRTYKELVPETAFQPYDDGYVVNKNRIYTTKEATALVDSLKDELEQHLTFSPKYAELRDTAKSHGGDIDLHSRTRVTVTLPKATFGPEDPVYETRCFSYSDSGLRALKTWMELL